MSAVPAEYRSDGDPILVRHGSEYCVYHEEINMLNSNPLQLEAFRKLPENFRRSFNSTLLVKCTNSEGENDLCCSLGF